MKVRFPSRVVGVSPFMRAVMEQGNKLRTTKEVIELHDVPQDVVDTMILIGFFCLPNIKLISTRPEYTYQEMSMAELIACAFCGQPNSGEKPCKTCGGPRIHFNNLTSIR